MSGIACTVRLLGSGAAGGSEVVDAAGGSASPSTGPTLLADGPGESKSSAGGGAAEAARAARVAASAAPRLAPDGEGGGVEGTGREEYLQS